MWGLIWRLIVRLFGPARVIFDRDGKGPYLSRVHLVGGPKMPDGSSPFDDEGHHLKPGASWPNRKWGLYLHRFHRSDDAGDLHSHPWRWAVSLILRGGYVEERYVEDGVSKELPIRVRRFRPGMINLLTKTTFHRVDLVGGRECLTLLMVGPKFSSWGFRRRDTGEFVPWRDYIAERRAS